MTVDSTQRFTRNRPCPICRGYDNAPRAKHQRCYGFLSDDGRFAHCTREEHANGLPLNPNSNTYAHHMGGPCDCGVQHGQFDEPHEPKSRGRIVETYDYRDAAGDLRFQVVRYEPKTFKQRRPNGKGGWTWNLKGVQRIPYRLPELLAADPIDWVFVPEGERDVDQLQRLGLVATTNPGGVGKWRDDYSSYLADRNVVVLPDNDEKGIDHARSIATQLSEYAKVVKVVHLPDLPNKGDVSDWLDAGHTIPKLLDLVERTDTWAEVVSKETAAVAELLGATSKRSQADKLVELVEAADIELFVDRVGESWARIEINGHFEINNCRSKDFKRFLGRLYWLEYRKAPNSNAISSALNVVEAKARYDGASHTLYNRVALHDGAIWYDLSDAGWRAIRIAASGWEIVTRPPILFRRYAHQQPQVEPESGGDMNAIFDFVNIQDEPHQVLFKVYLISCLIPSIAHPIPTLHGPQGSTKTTAFRCARRIVDPSATEALTLPRKSVELVQQLSHHWMPTYDNITHIDVATSDALCRASTGEGFSKRQLYTDDDDVIYTFRCCVGLNGINIAAYKPDLLDRCILFGFERIPKSRRRGEEELWDRFERLRPRLLGAALDALSQAMRLRPSIELPELPRMADFAAWGVAIARALGHTADEFLGAYQENYIRRNEEVLVGDPVASTLTALMDGRCEWSGAATDLLGELARLAERNGVDTKSRSWPKAPHSLTRRLNELSTNLGEIGINVTTGARTTRGRLIEVRKVPDNSVNSVMLTATPVVSTVTNDAIHDALHDAIAPPSSKASCGASSEKPLDSRQNDAIDANDAISGSFSPSDSDRDPSRDGDPEVDDEAVL